MHRHKIIKNYSIYDDYCNNGSDRILLQGQTRLVNVLAKLYSKVLNRNVNPETEVLVTCGAYEGLYSSIAGNVEVNDEVIIVEPFFDCFEPMVLVAGGIVRFIPLERVILIALFFSQDIRSDGFMRKTVPGVNRLTLAPSLTHKKASDQIIF